MTVLDVPGVANIRDVGGIDVGASRVRDGVLMRSGHLASLTAEGESMLASFIRRVVDLRDDREVAAQPSAFRAVETIRVPLFLGSAASFFTDDLSLADMYRHLVAESAERFVEAIRHIADGAATLVNCTVGKDRTGVTIALALSAVGADRDQVVEDYALTASQLPLGRTRAVIAYVHEHHPGARHAVELATASPAPVMRDLLAQLDAEYGSVPSYLRAHGLTQAELDRLGATLVD